MKNRTIVTLMCVVALIAFGLPILIGLYMGSSSENTPASNPLIFTLGNYLSALLFLVFVFVCFAFLPMWAWFKGERKFLALGLACISIFFAWLIVSYLRDPDTTGDHGMVVVGFIFIVPPFAFIVQLVVCGLTKIVSRKGGVEKNA